jgi:hypothetical protein
MTAARCCGRSASTSDVTTVLVPAARVVRWFENFESRHGGASYDLVAGRLHATGTDGSTALAALPLDQLYDGPPLPDAFADSVRPPELWGILLVRKGGFAVARLAGTAPLEHKIGQRHVQGRTKAGGQSQQRFARRRDNQATAAYAAAADHAARILTGPIEALVTGGDRSAVDTVLADSRLRTVAARRTTTWLDTPDPKRAVLDQAVLDACSVSIDVVDA